MGFQFSIVCNSEQSRVGFFFFFFFFLFLYFLNFLL